MACSCMVKGGTFRITSMPVQKINQVTGIEPISFCHWAAPTFGDVGVTTEKTWYKAAMIAVATLNTLAQIQIATKRYNIAREYANLAQDQWRRFRDTYAPCETATVNEICNTPEYTPQYNEMAARFGGYSDVGFANAQQHLSRLGKMYSLCMDPSLVASITLAGAMSRDDSINYAYRIEEAEKDIQDDLRWNRRSSMLNLGKNIHAQSAKYAEAANGALSNMSEMAGKGAAGAAYGLGYLAERNQPFQNTSPISGLNTNYNGTLASWGVNDIPGWTGVVEPSIASSDAEIIGEGENFF